MRANSVMLLAIGTLGLAACGSEVEEPVEQIVVAEPGEAASYPQPEENSESEQAPE